MQSFFQHIRLLVAMGFAAAAVCANGCGKSTGFTAGNQQEPVTVLATVYPLADIARRVGTSHVKVTWLVEGGQSIDGLVPDFEARGRLHTADVVLSGGATEPWADVGFGDPAQHRRIIRMDALDSSTTRATSSGGLLWLDPVFAANTAREICARLRVLRPKFEEEFNRQSAEYVAKIESVDNEYRAKFSNVMVKKVLVLSPDFNAMLSRYGIWPVQAVTASPMKLDDAAIRTLQAASTENATRVLLVPSDTPAATVRDIELRGGLQVVRIDFLGSSGGAGHTSYLELIRFDLDQLLAATTVR